jgi:hypothetical protein
MVDTRYDAVISDPVSGESQGLMLAGGIRWDSAQQMATRITEGIDWQSFDQWSVVEQRSWHHGRGLEKWDATDPERFYDSWNLDTRIRDQVTLAPGQGAGQLGGVGYAYPGAGTIAAPGISAPGIYHSSYTGAAQAIKAAQSFQVGGSPLTVKKIDLYLGTMDLGYGAGDTVTLRVETDSGGNPSGTLASAGGGGSDDSSTTILWSSLGGVEGWKRFDFGTNGFALSASTTYWLVVSHNNDELGGIIPLVWYATASATDGYGTGEALLYDCVSTDWLTEAGVNTDFFFMLPDAVALAGNVSCFCQFNGKWYVGAGKGVYEWDEANDYWVAKKTDFSQNILDMASFGGTLWVASDVGDNLWTYNGSSWTSTLYPGRVLHVYKGYLYRAYYNSSSGNNEVYYTADGSTWSASAWKVGNAGRGERVTGIGGNDYQVFVATTHGLYLLGPESQLGDLIDQLKTWHTQYDADNGRGLVAWARDAKLYIPVQASLLSYTDGILDSVGPDRDAGMPKLRQGAIEGTLSLTNWLLGIINAGAAGTSSVLAYNGQGWHELVRVPQAGTVCRAIGYDTTVSPNRLWFGYGSLTGYVTLPDITDNPYQYESSVYASAGHGITPWWSGGLLGVEKDFDAIGMQYEIPAGCSIAVAYEVDRSGFWTTVYTLTSADAGNVYEGAFAFTPAFATNPTITVGSTAKTINVGADQTAVLAQGSWVRINNEVRQVASVTDGDTFVLVRPLSSAPASGFVYPSRPCGAEIRLRFTLATSDITKSPKLAAWWLKSMPMLSDKLAGRVSAHVYDQQTDRSSGTIPESAAARVAQLHAFACRPTPLDITDKAGITRRVKITAITEGEEDFVEGAPGNEAQVASVVTLSFIEV